MKNRLRVASLRIPFRQSFGHASARRERSQSIWVEIESHGGMKGYGEGCPREYVTGETVASALVFVREQVDEFCELDSVGALIAWSDTHQQEIDANPAAFCAVELALLDLLARQRGVPVETLLGIEPVRGPFRYTAVLGTENAGQFAAQARRYAELGFTDYKVKLSGTDDDFARVQLLQSLAPAGRTLRFDANNLWPAPGAAIEHFRRLGVPVFAIEEPITVARYQEVGEIADALSARVILDESLTRVAQMDRLPGRPERWAINLRLSKMGGILRTLAVARAAQRRGIPLILGCQVGETSLLTRAALAVAQALSGQGLIAQEGAFGTHLLAADVIEPSLKFGARGILDVAPRHLPNEPGFGIAPVGVAAFLDESS